VIGFVNWGRRRETEARVLARPGTPIRKEHAVGTRGVSPGDGNCELLMMKEKTKFKTNGVKIKQKEKDKRKGWVKLCLLSGGLRVKG